MRYVLLSALRAHDKAVNAYATVELPTMMLQIYGKAEMLNPGGSVKDRVALQIIQEAFASGKLQAGGLITEGTAGSTGTRLQDFIISETLPLTCQVH